MMGGAALEVTSHREGDAITLSAVGELDLSTIARFESALLDAVAATPAGRWTTVDLRAVEYLDSSAINVLFANADRIIRVLVNPLLMRGLTISGLDQLTEIQAASPGRPPG